jgi:peptide/nickel transport system permease protein
MARRGAIVIALKRLAWRLVAAAGVIWCAATLTFLAISTTNGDTAILLLGGPEAVPTPETLERVRRDYNLDKPVIEQYALYLARLTRGDLGESYRLNIPVTQAIEEQLGATTTLVVSAVLAAIVMSLSVAVLTAGRDHWIARLLSGVELTIAAMPSFIIGIGLLVIFAFELRLLPSAADPTDWTTMILPVSTLALPMAARLTQLLRRDLELVFEQSFITTARARGLSHGAVCLHHALRHALVPVVTVVGLLFSQMFGATVIVELLFGHQGLGRLLADSVTNKDVPVVLGITILVAIVCTIATLVVDVVYTLIDPRLTTA